MSSTTRNWVSVLTLLFPPFAIHVQETHYKKTRRDGGVPKDGENGCRSRNLKGDSTRSILYGPGGKTKNQLEGDLAFFSD